MKVYQTDGDGFFVGEALTDVDPLEETNHLVPAGCVSVSPPELTEGQLAKWEDGWLVVDPPIIPDPVELTIETIRANAISAMITRIDQFTAQFTANMPRDEVLSWPTKAAGAEIVLNGGTSAIISAEAATLGVTALTVATDISARAGAFASVIGSVTGVRRSAETGIAAANTKAEVDAALDAAMATAISIATSMGLEF